MREATLKQTESSVRGSSEVASVPYVAGDPSRRIAARGVI